MLFINLLTTPIAQQREAFDSIEFEGFFEWSSNQDKSEYSVFGAYDVLTNPDRIGVPYDENCCYACSVIYGDGGWNRYYVYEDGTVRFSAAHATPKDVSVAGYNNFAILT